MICIKPADLECFWIQNGKNYTFINKEIDLPITESNNRNLLDSMKIPYKKVKNCKGKEVLKYWDGDFEEYEEKTAPLFYNKAGKLQYSGKNYTGNAPTREMYIIAELKSIDLKYALLKK